MEAHIGVIGLGNIGYGIASNLRKKLPASTTLHICDISESLPQRFAEQHGQYGQIIIEASPKDLANNCTTVISSLPSGKAVEDVCLGPTGLITASKDPNRLIIECSTIEIDDTKRIGTTLIEAGLGTFVDATVSGGAWGAREGQLTYMVGHKTKDDPIGTRILSILSLTGIKDKIRFCGALGMGQVAKIAHNYVCIANVLTATEGMAIGIKHGIDPKILWECMTDGAADSWVMHLEQPVPGLVEDAPSSKGYERAFAASLGLKDIGIANRSARKVGLVPSAGEAAERAFRGVHEDPRTRDLDHTSLWLHVNGIVDEWTKQQEQLKEKAAL